MVDTENVLPFRLADDQGGSEGPPPLRLRRHYGFGGDEGKEGGSDKGMTQVRCDGSGHLSVPRRTPPPMTFEAERVLVRSAVWRC